MENMENQIDQLVQALDELKEAEQQYANARDHHEQQEAREELMICSRVVNSLRQRFGL